MSKVDQALNLTEEWERYSNSLDNLVTLDEMWYERMRLAFEAALEIGYNRGFEDGRSLEWGLINDKNEKVGRA